MRTEELSNGRATTGQFLISTRSLAHPVTAVHAQTLLTLTYDGAVLPREYGFPMKLRMPTKLGYKNPKPFKRFSSPIPIRVITGKTWATTGSVVADAHGNPIAQPGLRFFAT